MNKSETRFLLESALLGIAGAASAQLFMWMLRFAQHVFLDLISGYRFQGLAESGNGQQMIGPHGLWLIPLATTLGGLVSGILVYGLAPEAEGHGTDTVVHAFHREGGLLRARVSPVKMLASAITIGSGGSAGREGPIALIAAGVGSLYAKLTRRTEGERELLVLAGMAAGLSAIFRTPMGSAIFAIEVLYGKMDFETGAFLYTLIASAVAYTVNGAFVGWEPLFRVPPIATPGITEYAWYLALGVASGLIATILPVVFYGTRDLFRKLPMPNWGKPALGGLGVGLLALRFPQVLGGGYGWIQQAVGGHMALQLLILLILAKLAAFALTVSSGGSGGVFAPSLFVGAMLGAAFAAIFHQATGVFAVVGMAAVFGAAARVPIATILMVTEMTGGYHLLVPAAVAVLVAYILQLKFSSFFKYQSLYEAQVPTRRDSPAHYLEHIQIALSLLGRRNLPALDKLGHIDLLQLLRSRIGFDLPGGKQLTMGVVREKGSLNRQTVRDLYRNLQSCEFEVVAILRREDVLLPHPDTILEAKDRIIFIETPLSCERLRQQMDPPQPVGATPTVPGVS